ncbi:MAG: isoprenylcysteine carboxylmethyltransferase family protein [Chromatiales bacterium]|nr:isoprenylcysteine carboxylmethyltransferase family protein [Chromatiales bacterium]
MKSRTQDLPPLTGARWLVRELRYHEASRQGVGLLLMPLFALLAQPRPLLFIPGLLVALVGIAVRLHASGFIVKNKQLATDGPYALVRHPLYTGNLLLLAGFTIASGLWWAPLVAIAFWWFWYPPAIDYEDRKLGRIFGQEWQHWARTVPAVVPRRFALPSWHGWSFATSLRQNAEPLIVLYALAWLAVINARL